MKAEKTQKLKDEEEELHMLHFQYNGTTVITVKTSGDQAEDCGTSERSETTSFHVLQAFRVSFLSFTLLSKLVTLY